MVDLVFRAKRVLSRILDRKKKDRLRYWYYNNYHGLDIGIGSRIAGDISDISSSTQIGRYTNIQPHTEIRGSNKVTIGNFCSIADHVRFQSSNHSMNKLGMNYRLYNQYLDAGLPERDEEGITVGHDVWIGKGATILPGVTIGSGAVVGAESVVTKDVEPYEIVAGVPAENKGYRFDEETITVLMEVEWWTWDIDMIKDDKELFTGDVTSVLDELKVYANQDSRGSAGAS